MLFFYCFFSVFGFGYRLLSKLPLRTRGIYSDVTLPYLTLPYFFMGTESLRHQFKHLYDHISESDIKGFVYC
jgi:hypothetical protein